MNEPDRHLTSDNGNDDVRRLEALLAQTIGDLDTWAHDLRGPVGNIMGFAGLVLEHDSKVDPDVALNRILDNAQVLADRIDRRHANLVEQIRVGLGQLASSGSSRSTETISTSTT